MVIVENLTFGFGDKNLFQDVNLKFLPGFCYGVIGANGSGKSTFLKLISGEIEYNKGSITTKKNQRIAVLCQDHFLYDKYPVIETVTMGHKRLYDVMQERDKIYAKQNMNDEDGLKVAELEDQFGQLGGWESETEIHVLLDGLGIPFSNQNKMMRDLDENQKVRILLAQALFGNPDVLILDEPTNGLDWESVHWLEEFLIKFENIIIVVSHDRHFLNQICTHIVDVDCGKIQLFSGNYDFWYHMNQMLTKHSKEQNKKREEKVKALKEFIARFSSNASKSRQATSRKKILAKLTPEDLQASTRRFPYINFKAKRACGNKILILDKLSKQLNKEEKFENVSFTINRGDKVAFVGKMHKTKSLLFDILMGKIKQDSGTFEWGQTISISYFPKENESFFDNDLDIISWIGQHSNQKNADETFIRGCLGRMLFSGDESLKLVRVLSGGEKVRCMLSRLMLSEANVLILDEPTNHLDLESITALNDALVEFPEVVLFNCHDHEFVSSIANRIIELTPRGIIDESSTFEEYINNQKIRSLRAKLWGECENLKFF